MLCRFKKTGAIVDVPVEIRGDEWELVKAPVKPEEKKQDKKTTRSARKKAKNGDDLRNNG